MMKKSSLLTTGSGVLREDKLFFVTLIFGKGERKKRKRKLLIWIIYL